MPSKKVPQDKPNPSKGRASIGELDAASFLASLSNGGFEEDASDGGDDNHVDLNETKSSFKTAIAHDDEGENETNGVAKPSISNKKARRAQEQPAQVKAPKSSSKKKSKIVFDDEAENEDEGYFDAVAEDDDEEVPQDKHAAKKKSATAEKKTNGSTKKRVKNDEEDEEETHRHDLQKLKESDPEFYKHLEKEGRDLLDFGGDDDDDAPEDDDDMEEEEGDEENDFAEESREEQQRNLTVDSVKKLEARALRGDAASTRKLIRCFRNAMNVNLKKGKPNKKRGGDDDEDEDDDNELRQNDRAMQKRESNALRFSVPSDVYERLITVSLTRIASALDLMLWPSKKDTKEKQQKQQKRPPLASASPKFAGQAEKIRQLLSTLTGTLLSKDTSADVLQHLLLTLRLYIPYFASIKSEGKKLIQVLVQIWSKTGVDGATRIASFFRLRQLCNSARHDFLEQTLKDMYVSFARGATSSKSDEVRDRISVQAKCLLELYGLDLSMSYRIGFQHIRQLALHVRSAMSSKTTESLQSVCSWQFVHCMRLWGLILSTHCNGGMRELAFPLIQVALGVLTLVSTSRYDPLRLHCIDVVNRLCDATGEYAPVGMHVMQILASNDLVQKKIVPSTDTPPELSALLKLKQDQIRKASCRLVLIPRAVDVLRAHLKTHRSSVSFPELWLSHRQGLIKTGLVGEGKAAGQPSGKKWKGMKGGKKRGGGEESDAWRIQASRAMSTLIEEADEWARQVKEAREGRVATIKRPGGPSNIDGCEKFVLQMRAVFESQDEANKKKTPTQQDMASADSFFPGSLNDSVDEILKEAAAEHVKDRAGKADEDDASLEDEVDVDYEEETVKPLNPKEFL